MVSDSYQPGDMELFEASAAKPEPLRILKHGNTISSCPISWEYESTRAEHGSLDQAGLNRRTKAPFSDDGRLNIRKTRRNRGALTDSLFEVHQMNAYSQHPIPRSNQIESSEWLSPVYLCLRTNSYRLY